MTLKKNIAIAVVLTAIGAGVADSAWVRIGGRYIWTSIGWEDQIKCSNINNNHVNEPTSAKSFVAERVEALCRNHGGNLPASDVVTFEEITFSDEAEFTEQLEGQKNVCSAEGEINTDFFANFFDCQNDNWYVDVDTILVQRFRVVTTISYIDQKGNLVVKFESGEECYELPEGYSPREMPDPGTEFIQVTCD